MTTYSRGIPQWAAALIAAGERFALLAEQELPHSATMALCLPRVDYAAALVGLGMVKERLAHSSADSQQERLNALLDKWVIFRRNPTTAIVGILECCALTNQYKIREYKRTPTDLGSMTPEQRRNFTPPKSTGLWWIVEPKEYSKVQPTGREFNPNRRVGSSQIKDIKAASISISTLSDFLGWDLLESTLSSSGRLFTIYGNKSRINLELSEPLFKDAAACLGAILRPEGHTDYRDSFHCSLQANRSPLPDIEGALVIIEASRNLPEQLAASRKLNRVILLGRNSADYEDCANQIMQECALRMSDPPRMDIQFPPSVRSLAFYQK